MSSEVRVSEFGHAEELAGLDALERPEFAERAIRKKVWREIWPKIGAVLLFFAVWQVAYWSHHWATYVLPSPWTVIRELGHMISTGQFWHSAALTGRRALVGFAVAMIVGLSAGLAAARFWVVRSAVTSLLTGLQSMPTVVWAFPAILLFQLSEGGILFVVIMGTSPTVAKLTISAIDHLPPVLLRAGKTLGARGWSFYRYVAIPAAVPSLVTAFQQGWAFTWRSLMTAEILVPVAGKFGLGSRLENANTQAIYSVVLAYVLVILIIGILADSAFDRLDLTVRRRWGLIHGK